VRRDALRRGIINGVLWSLGNGLTSGTIIYYFAIELGARGLGMSLVLAAPTLAALLSLATPWLILRLGGVKATCLRASLASYLLLLGLALLVTELPLPGGKLAYFVALLMAHQMLEAIGHATLWSWWSALVPQPIRGRYFGQRTAWQLAALIPALLASGWFADAWRDRYSGDVPLVFWGYLLPVGIGLALLICSLIPLAQMPDIGAAARTAGSRGLLRAPFLDRRFRPLLWFGCWLSLVNGLTQAAQNIYPYVIGLGVFDLAMMRTGMRLGQLGISPLVGKTSDRYGNRPVMLLATALLATGPLFFLLATPEQPGWLWAAWLMWIAWAGINICRPNLMLKLAPAEQNSGYIATFLAVTGACYAVGTVVGGLGFDWLQAVSPFAYYGLQITHFQFLFVFGSAARMAALLLLWRVPERGAVWSYRETSDA